MPCGLVLILMVVATPAVAQVVQTKSVLAPYTVAISGNTINAGMVGDVIAGASGDGINSVIHGFISGTAGALAGVPPIVRPVTTGLAPPCPSPANAGTTLRFVLSDRQPAVELSIFDLSGRRVASLVRGALPAGQHTQEWNLRTDQGERVRAGLYFARLDAGPFHQTCRLVVLR